MSLLKLGSLVCQCGKSAKAGYTSNPKGPGFLFVCGHCLKPSRLAAIRDCVYCDEFYLEDRSKPRNPECCQECDPDD